MIGSSSGLRSASVFLFDTSKRTGESWRYPEAYVVLNSGQFCDYATRLSNIGNCTVHLLADPAPVCSVVTLPL